MPNGNLRWLGKRLSLLVPILCCLDACAHTPSAPKDFIDTELAGRIDGNEWTYKYAFINPTIPTPNEDDVVFVFLPFVPKTPCPKELASAKAAKTIMVSAPRATKVTSLKAGSPRNLVFQYEKSGVQVVNSAKKGKLQLTSNNDKTVKGKILAQFNQSTWVAGTFTATVCDSLEFR